MERPEDNPLLIPALRIDTASVSGLEKAAKWTKFISITMFVFTGLLLLVLIVGASFFLKVISTNNSAMLPADANPVMIIAGAAIVGAMIIFTYLFLFKFSSRLRRALASGDTNMLNKSILALKTFFIISIVIGVLGILYNVSQILFKWTI
jgi:hypothetical protein